MHVPAALTRMMRCGICHASMNEESDDRISRGVATVLAAAQSLPQERDLQAELAVIDAACARGYFLPDEDDLVRLRYLQYLKLRVGLLESLEELAGEAGSHPRDWSLKLPAFATAFAAACLLFRATRFLTGLAETRPLLWKKLDEADARHGIQWQTFSRLYRDSASPRSLLRFQLAADYYARQRDGIRALAGDPRYAELVALLEEEEPWIERRRSEAVKRHFLYRLFSFQRRHRSVWRQVMFGLFKGAGSMIAELNQPGVKPRGTGKRITPALRDEILTTVRAGDVFVTRHDDAVSNWFLPGFWPHAALYIGSAAERAALGLSDGGDARFLESKKDGVRFRAAEETLEVDALVVLRPPLQGADLSDALRRAMAHAGKGYDFLFDFRASDRLACTAVIYRGFHGVGAVAFQLRETSGRLCLPAEDLIDQALACGFEVVAAAGVGCEQVLQGAEARAALVASRKVS